MSGIVALCADEMSLKMPQLLGLEDLTLESIGWLETFTSGAELRSAVAAGKGFEEVWIISSQDVPEVNLVAALRRDGFSGVVVMVTSDPGGSCRSRASSAGVTEVEDPEGFSRRFAIELRRRARMGEVADAYPEGLGVPLSGNPRKGGLAATASQAPSRECKGSGLLMTIASGSGGVGKSVVAACLAAQLASHGARVILLDCDLQFGMLPRAFGQERPLTFEDVLPRASMFAKMARQAKVGEVALVGAPARLERSELLAESVPDLASAATDQFDIVVADLGTAWSDMHAALLEMASRTLFMVDQRSGSVRACQHALELCQRVGIAAGTFAFALNHCSKTAPFIPADISCALGGVPVQALSDGGSEVDELCSLGAIKELAASANPFARSVEKLAATLFPAWVEVSEVEVETKSGFTAFWGFGRSRRRRRGSRRDEPFVIKAGAPYSAQVRNGGAVSDKTGRSDGSESKRTISRRQRREVRA